MGLIGLCTFGRPWKGAMYLLSRYNQSQHRKISMPRATRGKESQQCEGTVKSTGERCKKKAIKGQRFCRSHNPGYKTNFKSGVANPNFKHGRYSVALPERLKEVYDAFVSDRELLDLKHGIALLETRVFDLASKVDTGESGALWKNLMAKKAAYERARGQEGETEAFMDLMEAIDKGHADWMIWEEIAQMLDVRRRMTATETQRLEKMQQFITAEQAMTLMVAVMASVKKRVDDPAVRGAIADDLRQLQSVQISSVE